MLQSFELICYQKQMFFETAEPGCSQSHLLSLFETQKKICHEYIKIASQQLYSREAQILSNANELLERIASKEVVKDLSEWDVFSTRDSVVLEDDPSFNLSSFSTESRGKHIQRKSVRGPRPSRELEGYLSECLQEIEEHCSSRTYSTVQKVAEEYRKLKMKMFECEKKEKNMRAREKLIEELQEKNAILTRKIEDTEDTLQKLKAENTVFKNTNSELSDLLHKKNSEINSEKKIKLFQEIAAHHHTTTLLQPHEFLTGVLAQKEQTIVLRFEAVREVEQKIERQLFNPENPCLKCCEVLRKMRNSIMAYKGYLQKEGEAFEKLVDNFKLSLLENNA